jgi:hypothetical protein
MLATQCVATTAANWWRRRGRAVQEECARSEAGRRRAPAEARDGRLSA